MEMSEKSVKFTKRLRIKNAEMDFFTFESEIVNRFPKEAEGLDIQGLYANYYL